MSAASLAPPAGRGNPRATLVAACVVAPVMTLVVTGPSVAVPAISAHLHSSLSAAQWVVDGYMLTASSSLAAMGSLADRIGHRRMFTIGMAFFALWMAVAGFANSILLLDLSRAIAGFGSGAALASITAMLAQSLDGPARAKAFGLFGTFLGAGLAFGPMFGGVLVNLWGWRSVFLVLAAVSALVLVSWPLLPHLAPNAGQRFDWPGTAAFTLAIASFVLAMVEGPARGWGQPVVLTSLVGCVVLLISFVLLERRATAPMFDLGLFATPGFLAVCIVPVVLAFSFVALVIVLPPYLTSVTNLSVLTIGLFLLLLTGPSLIVPVFTGMIASRVSQRTLFVGLLLVSAAGAAWLAVSRPGGSGAGLVGPLLCLGIGYGISLALLDNAAVSAVEPARMGMAAGMFNTIRLTADVVGMAGLGALVAGLTKAAVGPATATGYPGGAADLAGQALQGGLHTAVTTVPEGQRGTVLSAMSDAYTSGVHAAMWAVAAACALAALLVGALLSRRKAPAPVEAPATATETASETVAG